MPLARPPFDRHLLLDFLPGQTVVDSFGQAVVESFGICTPRLLLAWRTEREREWESGSKERERRTERERGGR
jgi:hypothetical protein